MNAEELARKAVSHIEKLIQEYKDEVEEMEFKKRNSRRKRNYCSSSEGCVSCFGDLCCWDCKKPVRSCQKRRHCQKNRKSCGEYVVVVISNGNV